MSAIYELIQDYNEQDKELILNAFSIAEKELAGRTRGNGHDFIEHPLGVAMIVKNEVGLQASSIAAIFLHEGNRFNGNSAVDLNNSPLLNDCKTIFPKDVIDVVIGLNKIACLKIQETNLDEERYRKLIVSYSNDPRVVLIKLADRLEIMRNLMILPASKREAKIMETILFYVPLAHQLGLYKLKSELEDLFLRYSEPEQYRLITNNLKATERDRENIVNNFIIPLKEKLDKRGIKYRLKARTKSAYSIWRKMQAQKVGFDKIFDVFAIRFIIDSEPIKEKEHALCWEVYSLVTEQYEPDTNRLRDWLTIPKKNGYESLHTTVQISDNSFVEVQIRTERMDLEAERGNASHWSYKGIKSEQGLSNWLSKVRDMLNDTGSESKYEHISPKVLGEVFVFTPNGELKQLPEGATVLDFAFDIHSNLGLKCTGGRINGKMASIKEKIHTGDVVEIISNKNQKPAQGWLDIVVSSKAKSKIKQKLKEEENKRAAIGKELLERRLKNWKLTLDDDDIHLLIKKYKLKTTNELYSSIGEDKIDVAEIKDFLEDETRFDPNLENIDKIGKSNVTSNDSDYLIIDGKINNVDYKMAKCCNPIFGDDVFGFVTVKEGIKIHRLSCPNAARLIENYPYRIQKVKWKENISGNNFQVSLKIIIDGDYSATNVVFSTINMFKASVRSFNSIEKSSTSFEITATIYVPSNLELDKIVATLKKQKGVKQVVRL